MYDKHESRRFRYARGPHGVTVTAAQLHDEDRHLAHCRRCGVSVSDECDADRLWGIRDGRTVNADPSSFTCASCFTRHSPTPLANVRGARTWVAS